MWITSTYLGKPDANARAFVYFFWEDYAEYRSAPRRLVDYMRRCGNLFGDEVSLFAPHEEDTDRISSEINKGSRLSDEVARNAPCLLLTRKPFGEFDITTDPHMFFGIPGDSATDEEYHHFFAELHQHIVAARKAGSETDSEFLKRVWRALELSPNFMGLGINLKKLVEK